MIPERTAIQIKLAFVLSTICMEGEETMDLPPKYTYITLDKQGIWSKICIQGFVGTR